ncbi:MAG: DUF7507 domain-containing protein [Endomicrobiales bacterium]
MKKVLLLLVGVLLSGAGTLFAAEQLSSDFDTWGSTTAFAGGDGGFDAWQDNQFDVATYLGPAGRSFRLQWGNVNAANEFAGGGAYFNANPNTTIDLSAYNYISFFIYTPNANMKADVKLNDYAGSVEHAGKVKLSDYVTTVAATWQEVTIPLAAFLRNNATLDLTQARNLLLVADFTNGLEYDAGGNVYIDNITFSNAPHASYNSKLYSGADKGTLNVDDMPGDTLLWWDQAVSSQTSNEVIVRVSSGYAISWASALPADNSILSNATGYFAYTLRNGGNRADKVILSTASAAGEAWKATMFWDKDKSGTFTAGDVECWNTIGLLPESTHYFLVGVFVPPTATNGQTATITVTARDAFGTGANDSWPTGTNDDTLTDNFIATCTIPSITLVKSTSTASGRPGDEVTYTLVVTNNGGTAATNARLVDVVPSNMELTNVSGDVTGGDSRQYYYSGVWNAAWAQNATRIRWTFNSIASSGGTGTATFKAKVK